MMRHILVLLATAVLMSIGASLGCQTSGVGDPCIPEREYDAQFNGFSDQEVVVESKSFQCQTRICLVNHFLGRVTCPYGQKADGTSNFTTTSPCALPGGGPIIGNPSDPAKGKSVERQCLNRTTDKAVYCSCRCANVDGKTDDGASYCTCPDGFTCSPLVGSIGKADVGLTGSYCIKQGTEYDPNNACPRQCDATDPTAQCSAL